VDELAALRREVQPQEIATRVIDFRQHADSPIMPTVA
jgi:hypothetical protein